MQKLLPEQHNFFSQIAALAFVNPFSEQRELEDCKLLNIAPRTMEISQRTEIMQEQLHAQLEQRQSLSEFRITAYQGGTQEIMKFSWLFYQFHEFQTQFNQFIDEQRLAGDTPIELDFAKELNHRFKLAGFTHTETEKFIALFYQLHRGFYFISGAILGDCPSIKELRVRLWNNIFTFNPQWYVDYLCGKMEDFSTLLLGATGTGKTLIAHTIGCSGFIPFDLNKNKFKESFTRSFQFINLSQYPSSLLDSELFGHKKGAFTGAIDHHQGLFNRCSEYGAVFIDEIGDIDIPTQVKLLNVIQDRTFCPVGSHEKLRFSGRVISATNRNIRQLRKEGNFRDDLYYRLCSDVIEVPSLQQRIQENPQELSHLINNLLKRISNIPTPELAGMIEKQIRIHVPDYYAWPGNVRELEQCIRRVCLTGRCSISDEPNLTSLSNGFSLMDKAGESSVQNLLQQYCRFLYDRHSSYEAVARITQLDRRTVKKYIVE
ncbi:MAG: sigma-54-dependent Fis family transcriptional regulator [Methylococcales bacterium]|nr:sigma-54-dependent Fis family transcriptional regulator [Methylococcales bacterium]